MKYLIFLLPLVLAFEHDGIIITIAPGPSEANTTIKYKGEDVKIITDADRIAFDLTKENIDKAVEVFAGEKATDVFIKSPTPWEDLYKSYKWREVKREFKIKDIKLANVTIREENLFSKTYINNETEVKEIKKRVKKAYDPFFSQHYWSDNIEVNASVKYELLMPYSPAPLLHGYISKVGQHPFESGTHVISFTHTGVKFNLEPGQKANYSLISKHVTTGINVEYETILSGDLAVNYGNKHEGHHFWAYDVNEVLSAANMTTSVFSSEYVEIEYVSDFKTKVVDVVTGVDIKFTP